MKECIKRYMKWTAVCIFLVIALFPTCLRAEGDPLQDWAISVDNTAKYESYDYWGDGAGSPYQIKGTQFYDELSTNISRRYSAYESFKSSASFLYNESQYRRTEDGFFLERFNLTYEKGDAALPFRAMAGDNFPFLSLRTFQRSLKGLQFEVQPIQATPGRGQSILAFSGTGRDDYNNMEKAMTELYSGASWAFEDGKFGNYSLNFVQNHRDKDETLTLPLREQTVTSFTGEKAFTFLKQKITIEGEAAYVNGDTVNSQNTTQNGVSDLGYFGQISGETGTPFTYRLRTEIYGKDFRPNAASVTQDYQAYEAHGGWKFKSNLNLRGRVQHFIDSASTVNPTETNTGGLNLSGPLAVKFLPGLSTGIDAFIQDVKSRDNATNRQTISLNTNFTMPVGTWSGRLNLVGRQTDNYATGTNGPQRLYEANVNGTRAFKMAGFQGSITPGLVYQNQQGSGTDRENVGGSLGLQLVRDAHKLGFDYRTLSQNPAADGSIDELNNSFALNYRYTIGAHTIGLEGDYGDRRPSPGDSTQSFRIAALYTFHFDKPAGTKTADAVRTAFSIPRPDSRVIPTPAQKAAVPEGQKPVASAMAPAAFMGEDLVKAMEQLADQGVSGGLVQPGMVVYETRLINDIDKRQRFALVNDGKKVTGTVLVIEFDNTGSRETAEQVFERARATMIKRLGAPSDAYEQGNFSANFERDVNAGQFIRIMEWKTANGLARFGIPQRLDRQVRMELQYAPKFPPVRETMWSVEDVR
jgi:hypothetical protein